jgi:hypothetical protein
MWSLSVDDRFNALGKATLLDFYRGPFRLLCMPS